MLPWLNHAYTQVQNSIASNKLHHAHIVVGKQHVGKSELVKQIGATLLCLDSSDAQQACGQCKSCQLLASGSHPDWYEVKAENQIGVDDIRVVSGKLNGSSSLMRAKVLLIHEAHRMTVAAANSLLKTLEEPTADTYLFLTSHKANSLLPTIVSRCRTLRVAVESEQQTRAWLQASHTDINENLVQLYWQQPLFLDALLHNNDSVLHSLGDDIVMVHAGKMQLEAFATRYQEHLESCLDWLQFKVNQLARSDLAPPDDQLWHCQQELNHCKKLASQSGINKLLLISRALASVPQSDKFSLE